MQKRIKVHIILMAASLAVLGQTCGTPPENPDPPNTNGEAASVHIALPNGVGIDAESLAVVTNAASVAVGADALAEARVISNFPTLAHVVDANGNIVLLAFLTPDDGAKQATQIVGVDSTAQALLFLSLGSFTVPAESWMNILDGLEGSQELANVSSAFETALLANPAALSQGSAELEAALTNARAALLGEVVPALPAKGSESGLNINPATERNGILVSPGAGDETLVVENRLPRRMRTQLLKTDEFNDGVFEPLIPAEVSVDFGPLPRASFAANAQLESGLNVPGMSVIDFPLADGASSYELAVLSPTLNPDNIPIERAIPRFEPYLDNWLMEVDGLTEAMVIQDLISPLLQTLSVGLVQVNDPETEADSTTLAAAAFDVAGIEAATINSLPGLLSSAETTLEIAAGTEAASAALVEALIAAILEGWTDADADSVDAEEMETALQRAADTASIRFAALLGLEDDLGLIIDTVLDSLQIIRWGVGVPIGNQDDEECEEEFPLQSYVEAADLFEVDADPLVMPGNDLMIEVTIHWDQLEDTSLMSFNLQVSIGGLGQVILSELVDAIRFDGLPPGSRDEFDRILVSATTNGSCANFDFAGLDDVCATSGSALMVIGGVGRQPGQNVTTHTISVPIPLDAEPRCPTLNTNNPNRIFWTGNFVLVGLQSAFIETLGTDEAVDEFEILQ